MANSPEELRESLQKIVLDSYSTEYKELNENWRNLEVKAQGTVTIAGIFIAVAFAYIREIDKLSPSAKPFLFISILCLMTCVVLSILALTVKTLPTSPIGEYVDNLANPLLEVEDDTEFQKRMPLFVADQIAEWRKVKAKVSNVNKLKANYLRAAHICLMSAILTIAVFSILKLLS